MKYFIDFEFLEGNVPCQIKGFNIPKWLIKPNNTIQPISVGICSSDGREYYAISKDFNLKEAWNRYDIKQEWYSINESTQSTRDVKVYWIKENVLKPIWEELHLKDLGISHKVLIDMINRFKDFTIKLIDYQVIYVLDTKIDLSIKCIDKIHRIEKHLTTEFSPELHVSDMLVSISKTMAQQDSSRTKERVKIYYKD